MRLLILIALMSFYAMAASAITVDGKKNKFAQAAVQLNVNDFDEVIHATANNRRRQAPEKFENVTTEVEIRKTVIDLSFRATYVSIEWVGASEADESVLVVADADGSAKTTTKLLRSTDNGKTFVDEDYKINNITLHKDQAIIKNDYNEDRILLVSKGYEHFITSTDAGKGWTINDVPADLKGKKMSFLWHPTNSDIFLILTHVDGNIHVTTDFAKTWKLAAAKSVHSINWGVAGVHTEETVFWTKARGQSLRNGVDLYRTMDLFETEAIIFEKILEFALIKSYLFVSQQIGNSLNLLVSRESDSDSKPIWNKAHFPVNVTGEDWDSQTEQEMGYQILDESDGTVFINVDNDSTDGKQSYTGNLYKSDATATSYTLSLSDHLFLGTIKNDFHRVLSITGTYITSQLISEDETFRTLITFDKGGQWKPLQPPELDSQGNEYSDCDDSHGCYLQLHNYVSQAVSGYLQPIFSLDTAPGLVIAHGKVGRHLNNDDTNLFLSRDGGYIWKEMLQGTYSFAVADHGGLIVACHDHERHDSVYFTWDQGENWNTIKISNTPILVNRILSKPGHMTKVFNLWGNTEKGEWYVITLDFNKFFAKDCQQDDYTFWSPSDGRVSNQRCVLGHRLSYQRRKMEHKCFNNRDYTVQDRKTPCKCTTEDFECNDGFYRPHIDDPCVEFHAFNTSSRLNLKKICDGVQTKYMPPAAYRKIAGDLCSGGVEDQVPYVVSSPVDCPVSASHTPIAAIVIPTLVALTALFGIAFTVYVYNRKKNYWRSRYMELAQTDNDDDAPHTALDFSDSDDDVLSSGDDM